MKHRYWIYIHSIQRQCLQAYIVIYSVKGLLQVQEDHANIFMSIMPLKEKVCTSHMEGFLLWHGIQFVLFCYYGRLKNLRSLNITAIPHDVDFFGEFHEAEGQVKTPCQKYHKIYCSFISQSFVLIFTPQILYCKYKHYPKNIQYKFDCLLYSWDKCGMTMEHNLTWSYMMSCNVL